MINFAEYPKTSKWARHLTRLSKITKLTIPDELVQLAQEYSWNTASLKGGSLRFSKREYDAIQYVLDWNGRCALLVNREVDLVKHVLVHSIKLLNSNNIVVFANGNASSYSWRKVISEVFPQDNIAFFIKSKLTYFSDYNPSRPTWTLIEGNSNFYSILDNHTFDHMIIDNTYNPLYETDSLLNGLALEISKTTVILKISDFWKNNKDTSIGAISECLVEKLKLHKDLNFIPTQMQSQVMHSYFHNRKTRFDALNFFEAVGAYSGMLKEHRLARYTTIQDSSFSIIPYDTSNRLVSAISTYRTTEHKILSESNHTVKSLVTSALMGNKESLENLNKLKTSAWLKYKANSLYEMLLTLKKSKRISLLIYESPEIKKIIMSTITNIHSIEESVPASLKPNSLCLTNDISIITHEMFNNISNLVFLENLTDKQTMSDISKLSDIYGFNIIFSVMNGTFDVELTEQLIS
jgi:hypothetical protein